MGDEVGFAVAVERVDDAVVVVRIDGDVDMSSAEAFGDALAGVASVPHVVIDLTSCTFLDSAGMRVIAASIRQTRISVLATDPNILRMFEITAVDTMISVHASLDEAL